MTRKESELAVKQLKEMKIPEDDMPPSPTSVTQQPVELDPIESLKRQIEKKKGQITGIQEAIDKNNSELATLKASVDSAVVAEDAIYSDGSKAGRDEQNEATAQWQIALDRFNAKKASPQQGKLIENLAKAESELATLNEALAVSPSAASSSKGWLSTEPPLEDKTPKKEDKQIQRKDLGSVNLTIKINELESAEKLRNGLVFAKTEEISAIQGKIESKEKSNSELSAEINKKIKLISVSEQTTIRQYKAASKQLALNNDPGFLHQSIKELRERKRANQGSFMTYFLHAIGQKTRIENELIRAEKEGLEVDMKWRELTKFFNTTLDKNKNDIKNYNKEQNEANRELTELQKKKDDLEDQLQDINDQHPPLDQALLEDLKQKKTATLTEEKNESDGLIERCKTGYLSQATASDAVKISLSAFLKNPKDSTLANLSQTLKDNPAYEKDNDLNQLLIDAGHVYPEITTVIATIENIQERILENKERIDAYVSLQQNLEKMRNSPGLQQEDAAQMQEQIDELQGKIEKLQETNKDLSDSEGLSGRASRSNSNVSSVDSASSKSNSSAIFNAIKSGWTSVVGSRAVTPTQDKAKDQLNEESTSNKTNLGGS